MAGNRAPTHACRALASLLCLRPNLVVRAGSVQLSSAPRAGLGAARAWEIVAGGGWRVLRQTDLTCSPSGATASLPSPRPTRSPPTVLRRSLVASLLGCWFPGRGWTLTPLPTSSVFLPTGRPLPAHSHRPCSPTCEAILTQFHSEAPPPLLHLPQPPLHPGNGRASAGTPRLPPQGDPLARPCREMEPRFSPGRSPPGLGGPSGSQLPQPPWRPGLPPEVEGADGGPSPPPGEFGESLGGIWPTELSDFIVPPAPPKEVGAGSGRPLPSLATGLVPGPEPGEQDRELPFLGPASPGGGGGREGTQDTRWGLSWPPTAPGAGQGGEERRVSRRPRGSLGTAGCPGPASSALQDRALEGKAAAGCP